MKDFEKEKIILNFRIFLLRIILKEGKFPFLFLLTKYFLKVNFFLILI